MFVVNGERTTNFGDAIKKLKAAPSQFTAAMNLFLATS
jgi:hypothetical protein